MNVIISHKMVVISISTWLDCEPSLYFAISGLGMEDSSVCLCGVMQVGEWGESRSDGTVAISWLF